MSRYDFKHSEQIGSLRDLIADLNVEHPKKNGESITTKNLERTLSFIKQSIGVDLASADGELPVSTLKTIKMLYLEDANCETNLFLLLAPPKGTDKATMEFSTATTIPRDKNAPALISSMLNRLSCDIDPQKLKLFSRMLGDKEMHSTAEKLLLHAERAADEVNHILTTGLGNDDRQLARAYRTLSEEVDSICFKRTDEPATSATESVFVYLETLAFRHFVQHYSKHLEETRIQQNIGDICDAAFKLSELVGKDRNSPLIPFEREFSVNDFHRIFLEWPKEVTSLVELATGFETTARQLKPHVARAKVLLTSYGYRSFDSTDHDDRLLSVYDIVAALCSFRYQQVAGTDYKPYWHGQVDQGKDPQRLFDKGLRKNDPHQHQGVLQIYLNRLYQFQAAFTGTTQSYQAWMQYQISCLEAYLRIMQLNDIVAVVTGVMGINFLCMNKAKDIVIDHLKSDR